MDFDHIRTRLAGLEGRAYWRSLDELADTPEFCDCCLEIVSLQCGAAFGHLEVRVLTPIVRGHQLAALRELG